MIITSPIIFSRAFLRWIDFFLKHLIWDLEKHQYQQLLWSDMCGNANLTC